jgi:hypothetical protein
MVQKNAPKYEGSLAETLAEAKPALNVLTLL